MRRIIQHAASLLDRSPDFFRRDVRLYELNRRFLWFIVFRFIVIFAFLFVSLLKSVILPHIAVEPHIFMIMAVFLLFTNVGYWLDYSRAVNTDDSREYSRRVSLNVQAQIILDFLVLGYLVYIFGGIESPLVYFFLLHNVISCLFFKKWASFFYTLLSLAIIFFVSVGPFFKVIPAHHFVHPVQASAFFDRPEVYIYHLGFISAIYLIVWFFASNITDSLKEHEHKLQEMIEEMIDADKEKTRYMLVTTHELKAPFSSIQSYVNVMLDGYAGDISEQVRDILCKIRTRCDMLMKMITQMLQLANISSLIDNHEIVKKERIDLFTVIESVVKRLEPLAKAKGLKFIMPNDACYALFANIEQLDILFNNILLNAINYSRPNTEISVEIGGGSDYLLAKVTDHGIGIKKEHLEKVFLEYFRSEAAVLANKSSTGLGLTIARRIMDVHHGEIWIESEEGAGTTVFTRFPVKHQ